MATPEDVIDASAWLAGMIAAHTTIIGPLARPRRSAAGFSRSRPCSSTTIPTTSMIDPLMGTDPMLSARAAAIESIPDTPAMALTPSVTAALRAWWSKRKSAQ